MTDLFKPDSPAPPQREPYVYRCDKHNWTLESRTPQITAPALRVFCPLCKDEFFARHIQALENINPNAGKIKRAAP